jgi:hypothetical protein
MCFRGLCFFKFCFSFISGMTSLHSFCSITLHDYTTLHFHDMTFGCVLHSKKSKPVEVNHIDIANTKSCDCCFVFFLNFQTWKHLHYIILYSLHFSLHYITFHSMTFSEMSIAILFYELVGCFFVKQVLNSIQ